MVLDGAVDYEEALAALKKSFDTTLKTTQQAFRQLNRMKMKLGLHTIGEAIWNLIGETDKHLILFTGREIQGVDYIVSQRRCDISINRRKSKGE